MSLATVSDLREEQRQSGESGQKPKPALQVLPKIRRRQRGLAAGVIILLVAALAAVLTVNIHVANTQYQLVQMTNEHQSLVHENEALAEQVQYLQSPQALSNSAVTIGMVMPATAGTFDFETSSVVNSAEEAPSTGAPSTFVGAPQEPGTEAPAAVDVSEHILDAPGGLTGSGALHTLTEGSAGQNGAGGEDQSTSADRGVGLNGGTIPAPRLDED